MAVAAATAMAGSGQVVLTMRIRDVRELAPALAELGVESERLVILLECPASCAPSATARGGECEGRQEKSCVRHHLIAVGRGSLLASHFEYSFSRAFKAAGSRSWRALAAELPARALKGVSNPRRAEDLAELDDDPPQARCALHTQQVRGFSRSIQGIVL